MMDLNRIVRTQITTNELEPPPELLTGVNDGSTPMSEVVKALGEYLTSGEDDIRLRGEVSPSCGAYAGLTFLANLLKSTLPSRINRQATQTLTRFFLSKIDDFDSLPPSLEALTVLSKLPTFDDAAAVQVYRAIVEQVNMKAYAQAVRHLVYTLFDSFLALHRSALKALGTDFLNSYTKMVDGEKDPRNLMLLFSMDRVILLEFDVQETIEDLFDITFCYFPISFRPPPNDPYGITAEDLKVALRGCMSATPHFAKMAIPLFLEKFATAAGPSMKDLMLSMAVCFPVYGKDALRERGTELWEAIKTEILYSSDTSIEKAALEALEALVGTIYPPGEVPTGLAQDMIKECLAILEEPEKTQGLAATKCLVAIWTSSASAGKFAISQALPQLFRQFNRPALPSHRTPILWSITSLLIAAANTYSTPSTSRRNELGNAFSPFHEALTDTLREGLRTDALKEPAIRGCVALIEVQGFWSRGEIEEIVRGLNDVLLNDARAEIRSAVVKGLSTISKTQSSIVETTTLPVLFHSLPDHAPPISDITAREKYRSILSSLGILCAHSSLFETLVIRITNKLSALGGEGVEEECEVAYAWDLLQCLMRVVDQRITEKEDVGRQFDHIATSLSRLCVGAGKGGLFQDVRLLAAAGKLLETLVAEMSVERQTEYIAKVYQAYELGNWGTIGMDTASGGIIRTNASSSEQNLIAIYSGTLQAVSPSAQLPFNPIDFFANKLNWSINIATNDFQLHYALQLIASLVNKRTAELGNLAGTLETIWVDVQDTAKPFSTRRRAVLVYLHIVRALALVRTPLAYEAMERVVDVLKLHYFDPAVVEEVAKGFGVVAEGKGKGRLMTKMLWAQKMWGYVLPKLIEGDFEAKGRERLIYLLAFGSLVPIVPTSLLLGDLATILPLLLRSLSLGDSHARVNAIKALHGIMETGNPPSSVDQLLHSRADDIVDGLLKAIGDVGERSGEGSGEVRGAALGCLGVVPDAIRFETLAKRKNEVIRVLGQALDDPSRSVRREAVECRARWYGYGRPI